MGEPNTKNPPDPDSHDEGKAGDGDSQKKQQFSFPRVFTYAKRQDYVVQSVGALCAITSGAVLPLMSIVFGRFVNIFNSFSMGQSTPAQFRRDLREAAIFFVYLFLVKAAASFVYMFCFGFVGARVARQLRIAYIMALFRQNIAYLDTSGPGAVADNLTNHPANVQHAIAERMAITLMLTSMLVSGFVVAFVRQWELTLVTATMIPATWVVLGITLPHSQRLDQEMTKSQSRASTIAEEALSNASTVTAFGAHKRIMGWYESELLNAKKCGLKKRPWIAIQTGIFFSMNFAGYALAFWYGLRLYQKGKIGDPGTIVTVLFSVIIATGTFAQLGGQALPIMKAVTSANEIFAVVDRKPEIDSSSTEGLKPEKVHGEVEIESVGFAYETRKEVKVLDDVTIKLEAGKTTAIVGPSGCGKSTIVSLIERFYDPDVGRVVLDGLDTKELSLRWLRGQIGLVSQSPTLFDDSVYENISYGLVGSPWEQEPETVKRERVREVCELIGADEFIEKLPDGYDQRVGAVGLRLSGGQRQRIAIARGIVGDPRILLLDEATSALDTRSEVVVQRALEKAQVGRTTLVIAHRLSTIKNADWIVAMDGGKVVEQGTHEGLLDAGGMYARLIEAQMLALGEEEEKPDLAEGEEVEEEEPEIARVTTKSSLIRIDTSASAKEKTKDKSFTTEKIGFWRCLRIILTEQRRHWLHYVAVLLSSLVGGVASPIQAFIFAKLVKVFEETDIDAVVRRGNFWALIFFVLALVMFFAYALMGWALAAMTVIASHAYRLDYFGNMIKQDISFFDNNPSGALASRLSSDITQLEELIGINLSLLCTAVVNIIGSSLLALIVGWKLALVSLSAAIPGILGANIVRMQLELRFNEVITRAFSSSASFASEAIAASRTVASLTLEDFIIDRYREMLTIQVRRSYPQLIRSTALFALSESSVLLVMMGTFWWGGILLSNGEYDSEQFFMIYMAVIVGMEAAGIFSSLAPNVSRAHASATNILGIRKIVPEIGHHSPDRSDFPDVAALPDHNCLLDFQNVEFRYASRPHFTALKDLDLDIPKGSFTALVGPSGAGKSTVMALFTRFYDPTSGRLLLADTPVPSLPVHRYRALLSLVPQQPFLFRTTIRDNIALALPGDEKPSDESIIAAAKAANLHEFILSLPEGYETPCGYRGVSLSGGQRQRVAISRALMRDQEGSVLLLDEATAEIDTVQERIIQEAVERVGREKGRTVVVVAHRLSTVAKADKIWVLRDGTVVEVGNHEELVGKKGVYWGMCLAQSLDRKV